MFIVPCGELAEIHRVRPGDEVEGALTVPPSTEARSLPTTRALLPSAPPQRRVKQSGRGVIFLCWGEVDPGWDDSIDRIEDFSRQDDVCGGKLGI